MTQSQAVTPGAESRDHHATAAALAPYVVSADIQTLLQRWACSREFSIPDQAFFASLRSEMTMELGVAFPGRQIEIVSEEELTEGMCRLTNRHSEPAISLDRTYTPDSQLNLEATRMIGINFESLDVGSRNGERLEDQVAGIAAKSGSSRFQLIDDVIFGGESMIHLIDLIKRAGLSATRIVCGIVIEDGRRAVQTAHPDVEMCWVRHYSAVHDEICERDFYAGVPFSGRLIGERRNGAVLPLQPERGAPYFLPFGKPQQWASIPPELERRWSEFCLKQSIKLWQAVQRCSSSRVVRLCDLDRTPGVTSSTQMPIVSYLEECLSTF